MITRQPACGAPCTISFQHLIFDSQDLRLLCIPRQISFLPLEGNAVFPDAPFLKPFENQFLPIVLSLSLLQGSLHRLGEILLPFPYLKSGKSGYFGLIGML